MFCFTSSPPITQKQTEISETLAAHSAQEQVYPFFTHTCCLPVKSLHCTATPLLHCQPPSVVEPIHNCRPPIAACQMPASDIVHHCAGVSRANCHLFFFPCASHEKREWKKKNHHNALGEEKYGRSCQAVLEIIKAYTCWEACNISIVSDAATRKF